MISLHMCDSSLGVAGSLALPVMCTNEGKCYCHSVIYVLAGVCYWYIVNVLFYLAQISFTEDEFQFLCKCTGTQMRSVFLHLLRFEFVKHIAIVISLINSHAYCRDTDL